MVDYIEFYVACNPPLRPKGVKYVLGQLKEKKVECIEILYEPTVPWFQCCVTELQRKPLANFLTSLLHEILAQETDDFELDNQTGDIKIIGDDPMILNWGAFLQLGKDGLDEYEQYRYPEPFRRFAFKVIWQRLRSIDSPDKVTIKSLLKREGNFDWSIKAFTRLVGCEMSFNVQEDVLYLASNDRSSVDKAVRCLDSLFKYRKHIAPHPTQLILPPAGSSEWKICLRPISKFRLAASTIIQTNAVMAKDDYETLYSKGVISTYVFEDRYGDELGLPECPLVDKAPLPRKPFADFANYSYPSKQATSVRSARDPEPPLSKAVSRKVDPLIADWALKLGEGHELQGQRPQSATPQPPNADRVDSEAYQLRGLGSSVEFIQQGASQKYMHMPHEDSVGTGAGISASNMGPPKGDSSLKSARDSTITPPSTALTDLMGLSIPVTEEPRPSNRSADHAAPGSHTHLTRVPNRATSRNGHGSQHKARNSNHTRDLLGADDEDILQSLMPPMVPTLTPQRGLRELSPPREYRQTMNQRAPCRGRNQAQRHRDSTECLSPSPPKSSANRRSKIPIKSRAAAPRARDVQLRANPGVSELGSSGPTQMSTVARASRPQGVWNMGLSGNAFGDFVLSPVLRNSIQKRSCFEDALETCLASMLCRARIIAGKVSMEIIFCRIVIENVNEDVVNFGRADEEHAAFSPVRILNELALFKEGDLRSHPTLSLNGNDANRLKEINWASDPMRKWQPYDTDVFYDFGCEDLTSGCCFVIQVNATDFTHDFESQKFVLEDLVFIHCPDRSWDLNAYIKATDTAFFKDKYEGLAKSLVESLMIPDGLSCSKLRFSFQEPGRNRVSVERVRVRHVSRYRDGQEGNSLLNITMWQAMNMDWGTVEDSNLSTRNISVEPSENDDTKGLANVWYEASISSVRVEKAFEENAKIEFGEEVQWEETELERKGILKDLSLPAVGMVEQMDQIGAGNDNGWSPFEGAVLPDGEPRIGDLKERLYW